MPAHRIPTPSAMPSMKSSLSIKVVMTTKANPPKKPIIPLIISCHIFARYSSRTYSLSSRALSWGTLLFSEVSCFSGSLAETGVSFGVNGRLIRLSTGTSRISASLGTVLMSGQAISLSHFDTALSVTFNCSARAFCVSPFFFRLMLMTVPILCLSITTSPLQFAIKQV